MGRYAVRLQGVSLTEPFALLEIPHAPELLFPASAPQAECLRRGGAILLGHREEDAFVLERILSTDPYDYLNYEPGMRL